MGNRWIETILGGKAGDAVTVEPDLTLVTNGFSHGAIDYTEGVADPDKVLVMYDHNIPSGSPEDAKVYGEILRFAQKNRISFKQAKGYSLQYLADEIVKGGQIVVTGTRHAAVLGAKGVLGIGLCNTELGRVLTTGKYSVVIPETLVVKVIGTLPKGTGMTDAALCFLEKHQELRGKVIEFTGSGICDHDKAVMCYMAGETGAYAAAWTEAEDPDEVFNLGNVCAMLRMPCETVQDQTRAAFAKAATLEDTIQAGQIGGCNGGTIEDLRRATALIEGKKLRYSFRLTVCPATSSAYLKALEEGLITKFIDFGAQISAAGDHSIVPQGAGAMGPEEKLLTTGLYTFSGSMGCEDARIMTASLETIMAYAAVEN